MSQINSTHEYFDVAIVGCGPGGSSLATYLAQAGLSVIAIEKEAFPRYHIGESLTGMATNVEDPCSDI